MTFVDRLHRHGRERADHPALEDTDRRISWRDLEAQTNRMANALLASGIGRGARVAVMADADVAGALCILGVLKAGASVVPIPSLIGAEPVERILQDCAVSAVFVCADYRHLLPVQIASLVVSIDFDDASYVSLAGFLERSSETLPPIAVAADDEFCILYSSGTTGRPKGIVHSHGVRAAWAEGVGPVSFPTGVRTLTTTSLYSNWTLCALIHTLWAGGCVKLMGKFSPHALVRDCRAFAPQTIFLVPLQIARLLSDDEAVAQLAAFAPSMKWSAGSPLPVEHKRDVLRLWPGGLVEAYGMTEGAPSTLLFAHERPDKLHTVGRTDVDAGLKVVSEAGEELPIGEVGEIVGRAVDVMTGYHNDPAATEALIWRDPVGEAFFRSGDLGRLDDDGFLQILGRKKDMIISGGFNIYASDLEAVLGQHPNVEQAAVFAMPSDRWGESPAAAVVLQGQAGTSGEEIRQWANDRLGRLQRLVEVFIVGDLPRGALGKVLKRDLRETYALTRDRS
jgi:long-chain acyl-CoA synthetase